MDDRVPTGDAAAPGNGSRLALLPWVLAVLTLAALLLYQVPLTATSTPVPLHERSLANLRAVETGAVQREVGDRFYYLSRRHGNAPLRWGVPDDAERWAFCIRCPVSLQAVAPDVRSIAYVRSSLGQNIIVEMRGEQGRPILTREQVLTTLRDLVQLTKPAEMRKGA